MSIIFVKALVEQATEEGEGWQHAKWRQREEQHHNGDCESNVLGKTTLRSNQIYQISIWKT